MATIPTNPPANPIPGAVYIDTATNFAFVWTGNSWVRASGTSSSYNTQITTGATILPGYFAAPSPEDFVPQVGANEPINPYPGQIWTDTGTTPSPTYVHDGTQWVVISDGKTTDTSVDNTPPADPDTGDTFYELTTGRFYVYDGTTWVALTSGTTGASDTHSFIGSASPTISLRPDGTPLVAGDQFVNITIPELFIWTGGVWTSIAGGGVTASSVITSPVPPAVSPEGSTYYNSTDDTLYISNGTNWVPVSATAASDTHSFTGTGAPALTTRPDTSALEVGDQYIDTATATQYYYDGTTWVAITAAAAGGTDTHSFVGTGAPTLTARPDTTALVAGDQYVDTATSTQYYYDGTAWIAFPTGGGGGTDTHSFVGTGAPTLTARPDGSALVIGDQYLNSTNKLMYYYNGTFWLALRPPDASPIAEGAVFAYTPSVTDGDAGTHTFIGLEAGNTTLTGANNVGLGHFSARAITTGSANCFVGFLAGSQTTTGFANTTVGNGAGFGIVENSRCIAIGPDAMINIKTGAWDNTAIGEKAGGRIDGSYNVCIGSYSGYDLIGSRNVILGSYTAQDRPNINDNFVISVGDGGTRRLQINEQGAWELFTNADVTTGTGAAGAVLTSQGNAAPPQWTSGASGTFTSKDGQTITVTNGLITAIV